MIKGNLYTTRKTKLPLGITKDTKIDFEIPSGWHEVTLKQFIDISKDLDYLEMFSVLSGIELETIKQCKPEEVAYIVEQLEELYNPKELENLTEHVEEFELNGVTYKVNPNLINEKAGQWWDMKKLEAQAQDNPIEFVPMLVSMLSRPEGEEYDYTKAKERSELFLNLDVLTAFKIRTFFLSSQLVSLINSNRYLKKNTPLKRILQGMGNFLKSSVRYLLSFHWLKNTLRYVQSLVRKKK
jgi:hypothetical protein